MQLLQAVDRVEDRVGVQENWCWIQGVQQILWMMVGGLHKKKKDKGTWVKVRKGTRLTIKYNPYYIELSNTYYLLAEFSDDPSQADQRTDTYSQFRISAAMRRLENKNDKINKYKLVWPWVRIAA